MKGLKEEAKIRLGNGACWRNHFTANDFILTPRSDLHNGRDIFNSVDVYVDLGHRETEITDEIIKAASQQQGNIEAIIQAT